MQQVWTGGEAPNDLSSEAYAVSCLNTGLHTLLLPCGKQHEVSVHVC